MTDKRRLLSPMRRRLYPNARTGAGISPQLNTAGTTKALRQGIPIGTADEVTWNALVKFGWTEYSGPAETDERGYIVPGTDPDIKP